jgi:acetyl esterase/lipase
LLKTNQRFIYFFSAILAFNVNGGDFAPEQIYETVLSDVEFGHVLALGSRESDEKFFYGSDSLQFGELWLPSSAVRSKGLIVFVHGGCWLNEFDITHAYPLSSALSDAGYTVWSLEYRRVGDEGGGWPGTYEDIKAGLSYIDELSKFGVSGEDVVLMGHSAGGHLALLAGSYKDETAVALKAVVGLAAITNIVSYSDGDNSCEIATPLFMSGSSVEKTNDYANANPVNFLMHPQAFLLHGEIDSIVPLEQTAVDGVTVKILPGVNHFDWIHPGTDAFRSVLTLLEELL